MSSLSKQHEEFSEAMDLIMIRVLPGLKHALDLLGAGNLPLAKLTTDVLATELRRAADILDGGASANPRD